MCKVLREKKPSVFIAENVKGILSANKKEAFPFILEEFRKGTKSESSFWINYKERLIYIRYFAVRDAQKHYKGVIEMSQDITDIKQINGEKRLLEWNN